MKRILFHRGVYPAEDFYVEKRFGLDLTLILVSSVEDYIELTLHRLRGILYLFGSWFLVHSPPPNFWHLAYEEWLLNDQIKQMVVVLLDADDGHVIERWVFEPKVTTTYVFIILRKIYLLALLIINQSINRRTSARVASQMDRELSAVMKDVVTPTFLPPLEKQTVFDILVYTKDEVEILEGWDSTHPHAVEDGEYDMMKGLIAPNHHVGMSVAYRDED